MFIKIPEPYKIYDIKISGSDNPAARQYNTEM